MGGNGHKGLNRAVGLPEVAEYDPTRRGAADSGFLAQDVDTLGGPGVAAGNAHAVGEWVDLDSLVRQAQRAAVLIGRLSLGRVTAGIVFSPVPRY